MESYIFEAIEMEKEYPAKIFIASIDRSDFHWHYEYELILVLKGKLQVGIYPEPVVLKAGDIILINSRQVHELTHGSEENLCLFLQLHHSVLYDFKDDMRTYNFYLNSQGKECRISEEDYQFFCRLAAKIGLAALNHEVSGIYRTKGWIYLLAAELFSRVTYDIRQFSAKDQSNHDLKLLAEIITYLQENYQKQNVQEVICKDLGIGEKSLHRFLKNTVGMSVRDMVLNQKLNQSRHLLKYSDKPVALIAEECGFESENSFYRIFRQKLGMTPKGYRRNGAYFSIDQKVQGYLSYSNREAEELLKKYAKGEVSL